MKKVLVSLLLIAVFMGYTSTSSNGDGEWNEVSTPLKVLNVKANEIIDAGGVAAVGEGLSKRRDIARQKARTNAEGNLASVFNRKVDLLKKNFQEEVGNGKESEVNELFSSTQKTFTSKLLKGVHEKDYKILQNDKGEYLCGVLLVITPKTVNQSLLEDMESNKQLYQRFRSSKAFEELQKEIKEYEKNN